MKKIFVRLGLGILGATIFMIVAVMMGRPDRDQTKSTEISNLDSANNIVQEEDTLVSFPRNYSAEKDFLKYFSKVEDSTALVKTKKYETALKSLKSFRKKEDEFQGAKFYSDKRTPYYTNINFIYPYFVESKSTYSLRLRMQYTANDWLFIDNTTFLIDGSTYEIAGDFKRDNNSTIWEWLDIRVDVGERYILDKLANSKKAKVRYSGAKYYKDRVITSKEKSIIRKTLDIYDALTQTKG